MSRAPWRSLMVRLILTYALLAVAALVLAKGVLMQLEYRELRLEIDRGGLARTAEVLAAELATEWQDDGAAPARRTLEHALESFLLRLEHPSGHLGSKRSFILTELSDQPLAAAVLDGNGAILAAAPVSGDWRIDHTDRDLQTALTRSGQTSAQAIASKQTPELLRRYLTALPFSGESAPVWLVLELRVQPPWRRMLSSWSFQGPMRLAFLLLFGIGMAWLLSRYVTRRLARMAEAAQAWSRGELEVTIADRSGDELGRLAQDLNRMAAGLREQVHTRAQLASLSERQRLARDLHDTVKQQAFALNMLLAGIARRGQLDAGSREGIAEARALTAQIQAELVQIIDELRAEGTELPLTRAIAERVEDFGRRSGIAVAPVLAAVPALTADRQLTVLRVLDEALANVQRHSQARLVKVELRQQGDRIELRIDDDGRGLPATLVEGMGLGNMRARAGELPAGRLELAQGEPRGTRVTLSWQA